MLTRGANLESIARALTDRERHLDMWRQLRREPSHVPRRIAGSQLVESIDEKNQRLLRSRHRKPFPERVCRPAERLDCHANTGGESGINSASPYRSREAP